MKRIVRRIVFYLGVAVVAIVATGSAYEQLARHAAWRDFPPRGTLVDIGGRRIELDCRGSGAPIVVLVHGLDARGVMAWTAVHDSIARTTRTCAYSRAGVMHSDPAPGAFTPEGVASDLHLALEKAGERGPYVMVGHSLGGPYLMIFTKRYPGDVAGVVFVDASHPDQIKRLEKVLPARGQPSTAPLKIVSALEWTGAPRLLMPTTTTAAPHESQADARATAAYSVTGLPSVLKEAAGIPATLDAAGTFRQLGARPMVVLTAMKPMPAVVRERMKITPEQAALQQAEWKSMADDEASWSSRSVHRLVDDASHYIQFDRPDVVIEAVRSVVDSVRAGQATPSAAHKPY